MIKAVLFDMGGTLEDIFVDESSRIAAVEKLDAMLREAGLITGLTTEQLRIEVDEGWKRYGAFRDSTDIERKPSCIWRDYILKPFGFPEEILEPLCEPIAHMWEVTFYHRTLRPRVAEMLSGLRELGLKLGVVSNTAALYQVFDSLKEYGIRDYFSDVTLSSITEMRKPKPDIFYVAAHQLQVEPGECVYVGDTISRDIIGSKRAGFACAIQIGSQLTVEKDAGHVREFEPDYFITDIYDVLPIVKKLI